MENRYFSYFIPDVSSPLDIERKKELIIFGSCPKLSRIKMELTTWMEPPLSIRKVRIHPGQAVSSLITPSCFFFLQFSIFLRFSKIPIQSWKTESIFAKLGVLYTLFLYHLTNYKGKHFPLWTKETRHDYAASFRSTNIAIPFVCTPVSEPLHAIRKNSNVFVSVVA